MKEDSHFHGNDAVVVTSPKQAPPTKPFRSGRDEHRPLTAATLLKLLLAYPFITAKLAEGIRWKALLLWLRGVPTTLKVSAAADAARHGEKLDSAAQ
ncbi:DUF1365 family protein [Devosia naphthalenivorans]|uniref:DUF1365 family protein n=1 Tax=Devosia naphthalenivorans TaxID=2082392 RepID=UPI0013B05E8A